MNEQLFKVIETFKTDGVLNREVEHYFTDEHAAEDLVDRRYNEMHKVNYLRVIRDSDFSNGCLHAMVYVQRDFRNEYSCKMYKQVLNSSSSYKDIKQTMRLKTVLK